MHHISHSPRRPSVLHIFKIGTPDFVGGPLAVIRDIFVGLKDRFACTALVSATSAQRREIAINDVQAAAGRCFGRAISLPKALTLPGQLLRQIAAHDLIVLHGAFPLAELAIALGIGRSKPLIMHWYGDVIGRPNKGWFRSVLSHRMLSRAEAIIVADHMLVSAMPRGYADKCRVVPFGFDVSKLNWPNFAPGHVNDRGRLVLACGPLVFDKGFDVLVRAAVGRPFDVWIIGEGPERPRLQRSIDELGLSARVRLLGAVPDCERLKLMFIADVFAMPSRTDAETFGLVQLEAMAASRPIVNTALQTAVPRVARHGIEAITVAPDDAAQLGDAIDALVRNPERRRHMGRAAQARATARYSAAMFNDGTERIYRDALTARAKCPAAGITPSGAPP